MTMTEWAKREVSVACGKEQSSTNDDSCMYMCACYESALRAFERLMEDGHSGMSINITKHILNRLIDGLPLTPIEDTDDIWSDIIDIAGTHGEVANYQCKRMSSLFKYVYADGSVKYHDNYRITCVNADNSSDTYYSGFIANIIDDMYPITMPYMPDGVYRVRVGEFLYDPSNGDFDTIHILGVTKPDGTYEAIDRYFKEGDHEWIEIELMQYIKRKNEAKEREKLNG